MAAMTFLRPIFSLRILPLLSLGWLMVGSEQAIAQITPDATLGAESSRIRGVSDVRDLIEGGAIRGSNLFHSFEEFNIGEGREVYFANPAVITNIFSRVTGNDVSNIWGTLGVDGNANLFLLNPNGIIFGPNSQLDIRGSFLASSADRFTFPDGNSFSAVNPETPPLLTMSITPGLQYGVNSGEINNQGNLNVDRDFTLAGRSITNSGILATKFGDLTLQGVAGSVTLSEGTIQAGRDTTIQAANKVEMVNGNISTNGELFIQGNEEIVFQNSTIFSSRDMVFRSPVRMLANGTTYTTGGFFFAESLDGSIIDFLIPHNRIILAEGNIQLDANVPGASLYILAGGSVTTAPGVLGITINNVGNNSITQVIQDGAGNNQQVTINSSNQSILDIRAGINWDQIPGGFPGIVNTSGIPTTLTPALTAANVVLEDIRVAQDGSISISNQSEINRLFGDLDLNLVIVPQGNIVIESSGNLILNGNVSTSSFASGSGGDIWLNAEKNIILSPNIFVTSIGNVGGNILIHSNDQLLIEDASIGSISRATSPYLESGDITIKTEDLIVQGTAAILTRTEGDVDAGDISIQADNTIALDSNVIPADNFVTGIRSEAFSQIPGNVPSGNSGRVMIQAANLSVRNGAQIFSITTGDGVSGDIIALVEQSATFTGSNFSLFDFGIIPSGIFSESTTSNMEPISGSIFLSADSVVVTERAQLNTTSRNNSSAGNINIHTRTIRIDEGSLLLAFSFNESRGGNIVINASEDIILDGGLNASADSSSPLVFPSRIVTTAFNSGRAGDVVINAQDFHVLNGGIVSTTTFGSGRGGDISMNIEDLLFMNGISLGENSLSALSADTFSDGDGGDIRVSTSRLIVEEGSAISASSFGDGRAGAIQILSRELVELSGVTSGGIRTGVYLQAFGNGNSQDMTISTQELIVRDQANIAAGSGDIGGATSVLFELSQALIEAPTDPSLDFQLPVDPDGNAGIININAEKVELLRNGEISTATSTRGNAGTISLRPFLDASALTIDFQDGLISGTTEGIGQGGDLRIIAPETPVILRGQGQLVAETTNFGSAGQIRIRTPSLSIQDNVQISAATEGIGAGGSLIIRVPEAVTISENSQLVTETRANGNAGNVFVRTDNLALERGAAISARSGRRADGAAGAIEIIGVNVLDLRDQSEITVRSFKDDPSGNITIEANNIALFDRSRITSETENGEGGNIRFSDLQILELEGDSRIATSTEDGRAGSVILNQGQFAANVVQLSHSRVETASDGIGNAGEVRLNTQSLLMENGSEISASTRSGEGGSIVLRGMTTAQLDDSFVSASTLGGEAGRLRLFSADAISLNNSGLTVEANGRRGNAGDLIVSTPRLSLANGSEILASNRASQEGGNITLRGLETLDVDNSRISAETRIGTAGSLTIFASNAVTLTNASSLSVEARGSVEARRSQNQRAQNSQEPSRSNIDVANDEIIATAGGLLIRTGELYVEDGSSVTVSSPVGRAGGIGITADRILLNSGEITAETGVGAGNSDEFANVSLAQVDFLLLQDGSLISAEANADANGGNITIDAEGGFVVADVFENSDIIATAIDGNGGNIGISAIRIFGMQEAEGSRDELRSNTTNDISASSQFGTDGVIAIEDLGVDPVQAAAELPTDTEAPPLSQGCQPGIDGRGRFINTEQGGIPPSSSDPLDSGRGWEDVQPTATDGEERSEETAPPDVIVEAEGWQVNEQGQVVLYSSDTLESTVFDCQVQ